MRDGSGIMMSAGRNVLRLISAAEYYAHLNNTG